MSRIVTGRPPFQKRAGDIRSNPEYVAEVRKEPCIICEAHDEIQTSPTQAHHPICGRYGTRKTPDEMVLPLCEGHHLGDFDKSKIAIHRDRAKWVERYGPDTDYVAVVQDKMAEVFKWARVGRAVQHIRNLGR